jgi:hypothetical protein
MFRIVYKDNTFKELKIRAEKLIIEGDLAFVYYMFDYDVVDLTEFKVIASGKCEGVISRVCKSHIPNHLLVTNGGRKASLFSLAEMKFIPGITLPPIKDAGQYDGGTGVYKCSEVDLYAITVGYYSGGNDGRSPLDFVRITKGSMDDAYECTLIGAGPDFERQP